MTDDRNDGQMEFISRCKRGSSMLVGKMTSPKKIKRVWINNKMGVKLSKKKCQIGTKKK